MQVTVSHAFLPKTRSVRASLVMDHFGIDFEQGRHVIASDLELPIRPGDVVLFTGPSGSGKSSLMRAAADELRCTVGRPSKSAGPRRGPGGAHDAGDPDESGRRHRGGSTGRTGTDTGGLGSPLYGDGDAVLDIDALDPGGRILIDALPVPSDEALHLLCACGLGEAQLMLRTPAELSDGQRYRFRLALALARRPATALPSVGKTQAEACTPTWLLADEFTATLDRTLAKVISFNVRRTADRMGAGFLLATTHEDIVEDLAPDVHVRCRLDGEITVETARGDESGERQESGIRSQESGTSGQRAAVEVLDPDSSLLTPPPPLRTAVKKKRRRSPTNSHSPPRPARTGRISRGGITAARASE